MNARPTNGLKEADGWGNNW